MMNNNTFYAWLENQNVVWKAGLIHGFFLKRIADTLPEKYFWMENTGFTEQDVQFVSSLEHPHTLKMSLPSMLSKSEHSTLINGKIKSFHTQNIETASSHWELECTIELGENNDLLSKKKGDKIKVVIYPDYSSKKDDFLKRIKRNEYYDIIISESEGQWQTNAKYFFPQE